MAQSRLQVLQSKAKEEGYREAICLYCQHFSGDWCQLSDEPQNRFGICFDWKGAEESLQLSNKLA